MECPWCGMLHTTPAGSGEQQPREAPYGFTEAVPRWCEEILGWEL